MKDCTLNHRAIPRPTVERTGRCARCGTNLTWCFFWRRWTHDNGDTRCSGLPHVINETGVSEP
jgi:hypothetical protein